MIESDELQKKLWDNAKYFKEQLGKLGFNTGHSETPITPVIIGEEAKTMEENYEKLKKSTKASMETLISLDDYWKLDK